MYERVVAGHFSTPQREREKRRGEKGGKNVARSYHEDRRSIVRSFVRLSLETDRLFLRICLADDQISTLASRTHANLLLATFRD